MSVLRLRRHASVPSLQCARSSPKSAPAALHAVFEDLSGLSIDADFMGHRAVLDVERVTQAAATSSTFQFFVRDLARICPERNLTRLLQSDACLGCQLFALVGMSNRGCSGGRDDGACNHGAGDLVMCHGVLLSSRNSGTGFRVNRDKITGRAWAPFS